MGSKIAERLAAAAFLAFCTLARGNPALAADEVWRCEIPWEENLSLQFLITISGNDVSRHAFFHTVSGIPTYHYKIIENSDGGLLAVTNKSWQGFDGATRTAEVIALDKHTGGFRESAVALSEKDSPDSWQYKGNCRKN